MEQTANDIMAKLYDELRAIWDKYHDLPKYSYSKSDVCALCCHLQECVRFACNSDETVRDNLHSIDNELDMMWKTILIFPDSTKWSKNDVLALINGTVETVRIFKERYL